MNNLKHIIVGFVYMSFCALIAVADDSQSYTRENPEIEFSVSQSRTIKEYPKYINEDANHIELNGDDWSNLAKYFSLADSVPVNIVHIGDSHLQADIATSIVRNRMASEYGHLRGRGLLVPYKLAGTNQPFDYTITSTSSFSQASLLKRPWATAMSFTGIGIEPKSEDFNLTICTKEEFDALTVYFSGDSIELKSAMCGDTQFSFSTILDEEGLWVEFTEPHTKLTLNFTAPIGTAIHGINAEMGCAGLAYHVIGNNGAQYSSYDGLENVGEWVASLAPDLIIISLGTNEAFGKFSKTEFRCQVDNFVKKIVKTNPNAKLLLTTPSECQRKKGRRRRRSYSVNTNIEPARNVIMEYARKNNIPLYDWYEVAGGKGSSSKWIKDNTLNSDRIHMTHGGYHLLGDLFADALIEIINAQSNTQK